MKKMTNVQNLTYAAMFLALSYVLPFFTGQIPQIGAMLCPMHLPVLLCGFVCGWPWGLLVGFLAPLLRSFTLGMPTLFPKAVCMAFELAGYGLFSGLLHKHLAPTKLSLYISLIGAMIGGRLIWGVAMSVCMGISGNAFGLSAFIAGALTNAIPGIILQFVLIPLLVMLIEKAQDSENNL